MLGRSRDRRGSVLVPFPGARGGRSLFLRLLHAAGVPWTRLVHGAQCLHCRGVRTRGLHAPRGPRGGGEVRGLADLDALGAPDEWAVRLRPHRSMEVVQNSCVERRSLAAPGLTTTSATLRPDLGSAMRAVSCPRGRALTGHLRDFARDPLGFLTETAMHHGPFVRMRFGRTTAYLLNA